MTRTIYFGPPGTGKTTTLLQRLEEHLKDKVPPERIAFLTFTRRARQEAVERVERVLGVKAKDLPYFRTIHSMAFRALRLKDGDVMGKKQYDDFGKTMGVEFGKAATSELAAEGLTSAAKGDALLAIDTLARLRGCTVREAWQGARSDIEWPTVDHFARSYAVYKREHAMLDFTDVLLEFARSDIELPVDVAFVDEAQDLSTLQWLCALQASQAARIQYVAGDDDQAIYKWAGADVQSFMALPGDRVVLDKSYRLPALVHALSSRVIRRVKQRVPKQFTSRPAVGKVKTHANVEALPLDAPGSWLWLVRNRYLLQPLREHLLQRGLVYSEHGTSSVSAKDRDVIYDWERLRTGKALDVERVRDVYAYLRSGEQLKRGHKLLPKVPEGAQLTISELRAEHGLLVPDDDRAAWFTVMDSISLARRTYYRKLLRTHGTLKLSPTVQLETIHGAKGAEADNVALFLEQSRRTWDEAQREPDDEHRVWYVGVTRAREALHVVHAAGRYAYAMPAV